MAEPEEYMGSHLSLMLCPQHSDPIAQCFMLLTPHSLGSEFQGLGRFSWDPSNAFLLQTLEIYPSSLLPYVCGCTDLGGGLVLSIPSPLFCSGLLDGMNLGI